MQNTLVAPVTVDLPVGIVAAMATLKRTFNSSTYVPILSNLLMACDGQAITLRSTDLEITAQYTAPLDETCEPFAITVPLKAFADAIKGAKRIAITVPFEGSTKVTVYVDGMAREFFTLPAADYPPMPTARGMSHGTLTGPFSDFVRAVSQVSTFSSDGNARGAVLMGTLLEARKGQPRVRVVSTDGFRLGATDCPTLTREGDFAIILPSGLPPVLASIKQDKKNPVDFTAQITDTAIRIAAGPWEIMARLVDGQYPNYAAVIPGYDASKGRIVVNRKALIAIAKQAAQAAGDRASMIKIETIKTASAGDTLHVTSTSDTEGAFSGAIQAETHNPFERHAFNAKFLAEVCGALTADEIMLCSNGPKSAMVIFDGTHRDTLTFAVLMPLRA